MLPVENYVKYFGKGSANAFFHAGDGSWDEGKRLIPRNGISSRDGFGYSVSLSGERYIIGDVGSG